MEFWRVITLVFASTIFAEAKFYHYQKRETGRNVCDAVDNTLPVQCYCTESQTMDKERTAGCHLMKKDLHQDDQIWNSFELLKDVTKLTISNTRGIAIPYIPTNALKYMEKLMKVEIKYGNIDKIEAFAFANLSLIEEITLSDNQIKILGNHAFAHHRDLSSIGLDSNQITEINRDVFVELHSLEKLFLTNNKITTIHDRAFVHLINLKELEMDRNGLFSLNSETFSGLRNLQKLDLSSNSLEVIGDNTFTPLVNLKTLNLEENKIQMLDEKAFNGLGQLNVLNLAHNKLVNIENVRTFEGLASLFILSLKSNLLIELKPQVMSPILKNFYGNTSNLDVEDNNFPCDCRLDWFMLLMNKTQNNYLKHATENLKCTPDTKLRELWTKTEETDKNTAQVFEDESQVQNADYEYYDDTQLNGKLFYIDIRDLANCTNTSGIPTRVLLSNVAYKTKEIETTTMLTTKAITSPVPTTKSTLTTEYEMLRSTQSTPKVIVDETTKPKEVKTEKPNEVTVTRNKETFTTVRLVTVSAKPEHNFDHDMASDEARPDKVKDHSHRSIHEEPKATPKMNHNSASSNVISVTLVSMTLCFRLYFY